MDFFKKLFEDVELGEIDEVSQEEYLRRMNEIGECKDINEVLALLVEYGILEEFNADGYQYVPSDFPGPYDTIH